MSTARYAAKRYGVKLQFNQKMRQKQKSHQNKINERKKEFQTEKSDDPAERLDIVFHTDETVFDSVLAARMMKGCAPDSAQVWAAQKKA